MTLNAQEQVMLELINRARLDPLAEAARLGIDLNAGLAAGTLDGSARQILATNRFLEDSAAIHSTWQLNHDIFSHTGANGNSPVQRMTSAGYVFSGNWASGENISWTGTTGTIDPAAAIMAQHDSLFISAGHRQNILSGNFREIGIGQEIGVFTENGTDFNASMVTQNFALSGSAVFLAGVAYADADQDGFYSIGEGVGNVSYAIGGTTTLTAAAGGYVLAATAAAATGVTITPQGGTATVVEVDLLPGNVKLDLVDASLLRSSGNLTLISGVADAELLGVGDLSLTGNGLDNRLTGNKGANRIDAGGGNDTVRDGIGNDRVDLGDGNDLVVVGGGADTLIGGTGTDELSYAGSPGGVGVDLISGAVAGGWAADDVISGFENLTGSALGADVLRGTTGDNVIAGQGGNDLVYDRGGNDFVDLGDGNDFAVAGNGADTFAGGAGLDTISYFYSAAGVRIDLASNALAGGWAADDLISGFERAHGSNSGNDTIFGSGGDNVIRTHGGNDTVFDRGGNDLVNLGDGNDLVFVGGGADIIGGGGGIDEISYFFSSAGVSVDLRNNALSGGWAADDLISGFERVSGANAGNDTLRGTDFANVLRGNGGADLLDGRSGQDFLDGGAGNDMLIGGAGADRFVFRGGYGGDAISDFSLAEADALWLDDALWGGGLTASGVVTTFASVVGADVVFDFGSGNLLTLAGLADTAGLDAQITLI